MYSHTHIISRLVISKTPHNSRKHKMSMPAKNCPIMCGLSSTKRFTFHQSAVGVSPDAVGRPSAQGTAFGLQAYVSTCQPPCFLLTSHQSIYLINPPAREERKRSEWLRLLCPNSGLKFSSTHERSPECDAEWYGLQGEQGRLSASRLHDHSVSSQLGVGEGSVYDHKDN